MSEWVSEGMNEWMSERVIEHMVKKGRAVKKRAYGWRLIEWLTEWLTEWMNDWWTQRLIDSLTEFEFDWICLNLIEWILRIKNRGIEGLRDWGIELMFVRLFVW